jgi:hypothetical protein
MLTRAEEGLVSASALGESGNSMRDVAMMLADHGWAVFPCGLDKAPLVPTGFKARTKNVQQIAQWWTLHPEALPAICPGDNGLAAFDIDSEKAMAATNSVGDGIVVETGGTSKPFKWRDEMMAPMHLYLRADGQPKLPGVVVRYLAGYVIAPGARRGDRVYKVAVANVPDVWRGDVDAPTPLPDVSDVDVSRLERVRELVSAIPNPLENDREKYIAMAHMINGAVGAAGRDIFLTWAGRWPGRVNRSEDARVYDSLPPSHLGFEDLWVLASKYTDTSAEQIARAQGDFDILGPSQPEPEKPASRAWFWLEELQQQPELLAEPTPLVPFLCWPGRKTLFAGREKAGKSTLAFAGIARTTRGEDFLGRPTVPQRVLWLTEESLSDVTQRATAMGADPRKLAVLQIAQDPWGDLANAFKQMAPHIVVIDSLLWFAGLGEDSENSAGAWLPVFRNFDKLTKAGVALLLLHHSQKSSDTGEYRGSTGIGANVDVIVRMKKPAEGSKRRSCTAVGRMNLAKSFDVLLVDEKTGDFKMTQGVEEVKEDAIEAQVTAYLALHPGTSMAAMKEGLGKGKAAITDAIARLGKKVTYDKGWSLTPDFETIGAA